MPTRAQWARWEKVGLQPTLDLNDLVLNWQNRRARDLEVYGAITGLELERTIEGASVLTMRLRDPGRQVFAQWARRMRVPIRPKKARRRPVEVDEGWEPLMRPSTAGLPPTWRPDVVGQAMEVQLDGASFRLVGAAYQHSSQEVTLTFEDLVVYLLRRKKGELRANRAKTTRAQFVLSMLRQVQTIKPPFVCPELKVRQRIDKADKAPPGKASTRATSDPAGSRVARVPPALNRVYPAHHIGQPGTKLSERQVRQAAELAGLSPTDALHAAQIAKGESSFYPGIVQNDPGDGMVGYGLWQMTPNAWGGGATYQHMQSLGGLEAMRNPIQAARQMAWMFRQGGNSWRPWYGTRYLNLATKATRSMLGEGVETDLVVTGEGDAAGKGQTKAYQFTREKDEDSWTAIQRLAGEVNWRAFVVGEAFYFMSEQQLYGRRPRYEVTARHPGLIDMAYDVDWGKPVSEATLTVALDRWGAPPGAVILLSGFGPPDGRWLITSVRRDWFKPTAEVTLKQPGKQLLEPTPERIERAKAAGGAPGATPSSTATDPIGKAYAMAKQISDRNLPYVWGGGHARVGTADGGTGRDPGIGFDCSGYTCAQLAAGGMGYSIGGGASVSGALESWGAPGPGERMTVWANSGHVFVEYHGFPAHYADTSTQAGGGRGPHLRYGSRSTGGFTARHWPSAR